MSLKRIRVAPNHSFNRTQWCMPPSGPPFHYGPAGVLPHCADERARVEPTSGFRRAAPSNPRWSVTPSRRLRRPVLASPPPITTGETPVLLGRAVGPLRAGCRSTRAR